MVPSTRSLAYRNEVTYEPSPDPRAALDLGGIVTLLAERRTGPVDVRLLASTGSTNADLARLLSEGATTPIVVVAEEQTAGRGRLDRTWTSPAGASLLMSVGVHPGLPVATWGWLPLLAGVAVTRAIADSTGFIVNLKWPNDVVCGDSGIRKMGGILAERTPAGDAIIGIGLNVDLRHDERPVPSATSLWMEGAGRVPRDVVLCAIVSSLLDVVDQWVAAGGDTQRSGLAAEYASRCVTLGQTVTVDQPGGRSVTGVATAISEAGALIVVTPNGSHTVSAGDVRHLRPS